MNKYEVREGERNQYGGLEQGTIIGRTVQVIYTMIAFNVSTSIAWIINLVNMTFILTCLSKSISPLLIVGVV